MKNITSVTKPKIAVHKFSSCDGCQLSFINAGERLVTLSEQVEIVHFAEVGPVNPFAEVDIAFIEGSITTPDEVERIHKIREKSQFLIPIGACATAGGIQALRNYVKADDWKRSIYAHPEFIESLATSTAVAENVKVDLEIWGCPPASWQLFEVIRALLSGIIPNINRDSLCLECKRRGNVCVLVANNMPCMGPVTQTGCGVLCPNAGRECYECFGPSENTNCQSLGNKFKELGLSSGEVARRFLFINNNAPSYKKSGNYFNNIED